MSDDPGLRTYFTEAQMVEIVKAIYDHKQREKDSDPSTMYGKILYTADRRFQAREAIRNSMMFTRSKHKDWTFDQVLDEVQRYLLQEYGGTVESSSKYGLEKGYVADPEYDQDVQRLLEILANREQLAQIMRDLEPEAEQQTRNWDEIRRQEKENPDKLIIK